MVPHTIIVIFCIFHLAAFPSYLTTSLPISTIVLEKSSGDSNNLVGGYENSLYRMSSGGRKEESLWSLLMGRTSSYKIQRLFTESKLIRKVRSITQQGRNVKCDLMDVTVLNDTLKGVYKVRNCGQ